MSIATRDKNPRRGKKGLSIREMAIFAMLGALMFVSKIIMEVLPNIHILGLLIIVYTLTYRVRALIPIYIYVLLNGLIAGFSLWWVPYLYIWTLLWGATMLLHPVRKLSVWVRGLAGRDGKVMGWKTGSQCR